MHNLEWIDLSTLYNRISGLCAQRGTNITEMCRRSGASRGSLSDLKQGRIKSLSPDTLAKIAAELNTSVDYLLGRDNAITPAPGGRGGDEAEAAGEAAGAGAAEISEAQVRAWLAARQGSLTPEDLAELLGLGSADAAIMALCRLLPEPQKAALVEMVRSLAQSQGLLP